MEIVSAAEPPRKESDMENGKKNGGCLVGCLLVAGLSWMLFSIALVVSVVLMASLCEGSGSSVKFGKSRMSSGISSPEEEDLPRLVWERGGAADSPRVLRLRLNGIISFAEGRSDFLGVREKTQAEMLLKRIRQATIDEDVKGICLELDTPGGEVTAADVLYDALGVFRAADTNRFVVVHMGSLCCSGGYYIACAADCIVAHPTTTTGSIGVIMSTVNAAELAKKVGVESVTIATGENKSMLDPLKPVEPSHVEIFRKVVMDDYDRFVKIVAEGRSLPIEKVREIADGRIFSATDALELKLIDGIGYRDDVDAVIAELAGEEVRICRYEEDMSLRGLLSGMFAELSPARIASEAAKLAAPASAAPEYRMR